MVDWMFLLFSVLFHLSLVHALVLLGVPALPVHHLLLGSEEAVNGFRWDHVHVLLLLQQIQVLLDHLLCLFIVLVILVRVLEVIKGFFEVYLDYHPDDG